MTNSYPSVTWWLSIIFATLGALTAMTLLGMWLIFISRPTNTESLGQVKLDDSAGLSTVPPNKNIFEVHSSTQSVLWGNQKNFHRSLPTTPVSINANSNKQNNNRRISKKKNVFSSSFERVSNVEDDDGMQVIDLQDKDEDERR